MSSAIQTADLDWQCIDGMDVPVCKQFGQTYFSSNHALLEARHVFLNGNDLSTRLAKLADFEYFCIAETSFGTGLNALALWQMWQQLRPNNHSHLHLMSVEKYPLTKADFIRAAKLWPELQPLAQQLLQQYPLPIAGCHRLDFPAERFSIDLWLGDASEVFPFIAKTKAVDAWFLNGFSFSYHPDIWQKNVLSQIVRLSDDATTFASCSVTDILRQSLNEHGISICCPAGFNHKDSMLKAICNRVKSENQHLNTATTQAHTPFNAAGSFQQREIAIIGAGIAGLTCAYAFARRGHQVTIYDQSAPLAGASGNPLALLNPRLGQIEQSAQHLVTLAWQYAIPHYEKFNAFRPIQVSQLALKADDDLLELAAQYPEDIFATEKENVSNLETIYPSLKLLRAGTVSPHQLRDQILEHALIQFQHAEVSKLTKQSKQKAKIQVVDINQQCLAEFDHVIVCAAMNSQKLSPQLPQLKANRGQVSWLNNANHPLKSDQAYSYGGYCMQLDQQHLILGASFYPDREDDEVLAEDHQHNHALIHSVFPHYAQSLAPIETWQGRASVRTQSPDYFPLLGKIQPDAEIYTLTALGSKGFLFAPLCSEVLVAQVLAEACPLTSYWVDKLNPRRFIKKVKPKKPYYQKPT
ncbi:tRNA U-34 5-methylaminomethyl-2-thiouridine biosynthesis protein MnmC domain [Acinetobacter bohemicus ANC 3994]|uniref:tRNA 5-methylaminomethyl-2-thiouridine biosynthesis bifunctional protein MnmC n=1 Tax=Acinetobacter bohemicus ANC 3994 TaxID=1217715 RepID=N8QHS6_9GAMM|nr:FAD-dependent 5-carboxymethylaminomethyl-2-thiouridine(34) oxidoreductase MnmC [Acinetobacter bohemicus]ENU21427.1 tRNA U-34 5-methylaminomethyl-2-thiouridine biosynthesis protein MnmC domain [Acinetobacter bohemicus ANC 3994]